jgi:NOL1/NOP2/fmu family ribosome biogenesis protein
VTVDGVAATFNNGSWWAYVPAKPSTPSQVVVIWAGGLTLTDSVTPHPPAILPDLCSEKIPEGLRIGWWSRAGHRYQMEHSTDLMDWTPASAAADSFGTGGWMEATDLTPATDGRGFSRFRVSRLTE